MNTHQSNKGKLIMRKPPALIFAATFVVLIGFSQNIDFVYAQSPSEGDKSTQKSSITKGPVTNAPLPRYVSLKTDHANVRRGPSLTYRIDWVYTYKGLPLRITAEYENWRRVEDYEGFGGWVHHSLLSGVRSVIFQNNTNGRAFPNESAHILFKAERGAIAYLVECSGSWCKIKTEKNKGWVPISSIWGVNQTEVIK